MSRNVKEILQFAGVLPAIEWRRISSDPGYVRRCRTRAATGAILVLAARRERAVHRRRGVRRAGRARRADLHRDAGRDRPRAPGDAHLPDHRPRAARARAGRPAVDARRQARGDQGARPPADRPHLHRQVAAEARRRRATPRGCGPPRCAGAAAARTSSTSTIEIQAGPGRRVLAACSRSRAPYSLGGPDSRFGAGREGHSHQGQDIAAAGGTPLVAPRAGFVSWRAYQADGAGHYVVLHGDDGRDYVFMHMQSGSVLVQKGQGVAAGQRLGSVGQSGHADGPHLHFEIWPDGWYSSKKSQPIDPLPDLLAWAA